MTTPPLRGERAGTRALRQARRILFGGLCLSTLASTSMAVDRTWSGGADDGLWGSGGNWSGVPAINGNDALLFGSAGAGTLENDLIEAAFSKLDFQVGAGAYTLQGQQITIGAGGIVNNSSVVQTIDFDIATASIASLTFRADGAALMVNGELSGTARIGAGGLAGVHLNGDNSAHTGGVTVNGGNLHIGHENALGSGTFIISGTGASAPTVTFAAGIGTFYTGGLEGTGGPVVLEDTAGQGATLYLTKGNGNTSRSNAFTGKGGLTLDAGTDGKQVLSGGNSYTGGTLIKSGTLELNGASGNLTGAVTMEGGELSIQRGNAIKTVTLSALNGTGGQITGNTGTATATLTLNTTEINRFEGDLKNGNGTLVFNKQGSGTFTFAGEGSYTGATNITGGTYELEGQLTQSAVTVGTGAQLVGKGGEIHTSLTLGNTSSLGFSLEAGITEPLLTLGTLNIGSGVDLEITLDGLIAGGTRVELISLGSATPNLFATINGEAIDESGLFSLTYAANDYLFRYEHLADSISVTAIPEPQSVALLLLGGAALLGRRWHRRRSCGMI